MLEQRFYYSWSFKTTFGVQIWYMFLLSSAFIHSIVNVISHKDLKVTSLNLAASIYYCPYVTPSALNSLGDQAYPPNQQNTRWQWSHQQETVTSQKLLRNFHRKVTKTLKCRRENHDPWNSHLVTHSNTMICHQHSSANQHRIAATHPRGQRSCDCDSVMTLWIL